MVMKKLLWLSALMGILGLLWASPTLAITVDFVPSTQSVGVGQPVAVDVVISGLTAGAPPSVGAFDLDVSFNAGILSPTGVTFGPFLGDPALLEALTSVAVTPGLVDFAEVSLLLPAELDALQPASFSLATLSFDALMAGTSPLTFSQVAIADAFGATLTASVSSGSINVVVPEPGTLLLLGAAITGLMLVRRRSVFGK
jgi:hypothetical protein